MDKKKKILLAIGILLVLTICIGVSYAYYLATVTQEGENYVKTDCFELTFEDSGEIVLDNTYPVRDSDVYKLAPYHFKIKNVCNLPASYQVNLEILNDSNLGIEYLNTKLNDSSIVELSSLNDATPTLTGQASSAKQLVSGNLIGGEIDEYDLKVWLKESVTENDPVQNKTFKSKVVVISTLNKSIIKNIVLHANGGTVSSDSIDVYEGYKYGNLPKPTKEGDETFIGWFTEETYENMVTNNSIVEGNVTDLYARWDKYSIVDGSIYTIGSVIKIAKEEFYVLGQEDSTHVKLLSKWNLNVGNNPVGTADNLQNSSARGYRGSGTAYATVPFSSSNYWFIPQPMGELGAIAISPEYTYYAYTNEKVDGTYKASIAEYVENYVDYLNSQGVSVTGKLINFSDLVDLGFYCSEYSGCHYYPDVTEPSLNWIFQTSYWIGRANEDDFVLGIIDGGETQGYSYGTSNKYGVRPVILLRI